MPNHTSSHHPCGLDEEEDEPFEQFDSPYSPWPQQVHGMPICPKCHSRKIEARHTARRIGGTIGTAAGASSAFVAAIAGAEAGATVGAVIAGPPGMAIGTLMGAILAAIAGGTVGGAAGIVLGDQIDEKMLRNHVCHTCKHEFSLHY